MNEFGKIQIHLFLYSKTEWKIECLRNYVSCSMPSLSVNVFKKFVVFWVESRVCSIYLEEAFPSWNSFDNKACCRKFAV